MGFRMHSLAVDLSPELDGGVRRPERLTVYPDLLHLRPGFIPRDTALLIIDLQQGALAARLAPYDGSRIVANAAVLGRRFEELGAMRVLTRLELPGPAEWSDFPDALASLPADVILSRRKWSAFHRTRLDAQLRARGITTLVLAGMTTNVAVEFNAREARRRGYKVVIPYDSVTAHDAGSHTASIEKILSRLAVVCSTRMVLGWASRSGERRPALAL